ncbi:NAD(+)/NADH kinase [Ruegeria atlantica]|uniref:NAD(+)/NADH kinase n=1 Tax=Ruegeria atlantica TaxID=81569 RepID=UPI001480989F|nr:NAD(+)/NADH kinase [Ruegeria atlantica]
MSSLSPRVVIVHRASEYQTLIEQHGTRGQASFFLSSRDQSIEKVEAVHSVLQDSITQTKSSVPSDWSIAQVERADLDRFLFTDNDIVVAVGQDGLVANLAKYITSQPVIGVTPGSEMSEGVLTTRRPDEVSNLLDLVSSGLATLEPRTMVEARLGNGDGLVALNELFVGHRSHQSARYIIRDGDNEEYQSSSGVIVSTGTGATGWAKSIMTATHQHLQLSPTERIAVYFSREPWPSQVSGCTLSSGLVRSSGGLLLTSRINEGGVIFADGVEQDFLQFDWGQQVRIGIAARTLNLLSSGDS